MDELAELARQDGYSRVVMDNVELRKVCYDLYLDCVHLATELADAGRSVKQATDTLMERRARLVELDILDGGI